MASGRAAALLASCALVMTPAIGLAAAEKKRPPAISLSFDKIPNFTPASADPRLAAIFARRGASIADFKFTPAAAAKSRPNQVRVAVRSRTAQTPARPVEVAVASPISSLNPTQYDLGVAVGWKRFAVAGNVATSKSPDPVIGSRETAIVGVSYNLKKFTGRVAVGGERYDSRIASLARPDSYSVDVGGSYNISRNIAVTGGVRYKIERDQIPALVENRRDDKAVYVGTAFKF
ncbi:MAG TPA: porin [Sphingomicrobium sp.]|nr:porin [Sphingomicrobium sp.]